jgi:ABC-2 type transport system permease protein
MSLRADAAVRLAPAAAIVRKDLLTAWSYRVGFVTGLFGGVVSMALFYYISRLVQAPQFTPDTYFTFVVIGIVTFNLLSAALVMPPIALRQELVAGTFERMLLAPGGTVKCITTLIVYPTAYSLVSVVLILTAGSLVFGLELNGPTLPLALPVTVLATLAFAALGGLLLAAVLVAKRVPPGTGYLVTGLSLVAGLYFPVDLLPGWIQWTSEVQPLTPAVELLRHTLADQPLVDPAWLSTLKLALFAAIGLPLSFAALRLTLRLGRRRGTTLEY